MKINGNGKFILIIHSLYGLVFVYMKAIVCSTKGPQTCQAGPHHLTTPYRIPFRIMCMAD